MVLLIPLLAMVSLVTILSLVLLILNWCGDVSAYYEKRGSVVPNIGVLASLGFVFWNESKWCYSFGSKG